jgi:hypothetical protein
VNLGEEYLRWADDVPGEGLRAHLASDLLSDLAKALTALPDAGDLDATAVIRLLYDPLPDSWLPYEFGPRIAGFVAKESMA